MLQSSSRSRRIQEIVDAISACDEVWVNGEGDFILRTRPSLYRTLVIMHVALALGRRVRLVNSILSDPANEARNAPVTTAVIRTLSQCSDVVYRDPESLRLHQGLMPDVAASWCPDALFAWAGEHVSAEPFGPGWEGLPPEAQEFMRCRRPYVAISGSSAIRSPSTAEREDLRQFISDADRTGYGSLLIATDGSDRWMADVAKTCGAPFIPSRVPLIAGMTALSQAAVFVSGRYHPSILATLVGTPSVLMSSNSHKTQSLQEVLGITADVPLFGAGGERIATVMSAADRDRDQVRARAQELSVAITL
jgi:polysaccharide pyruvyl transferase WcaK-like protein